MFTRYKSKNFCFEFYIVLPKGCTKISSPNRPKKYMLSDNIHNHYHWFCYINHPKFVALKHIA